MLGGRDHIKDDVIKRLALIGFFLFFVTSCSNEGKHALKSSGQLLLGYNAHPSLIHHEFEQINREKRYDSDRLFTSARAYKIVTNEYDYNGLLEEYLQSQQNRAPCVKGVTQSYLHLPTIFLIAPPLPTGITPSISTRCQA